MAELERALALAELVAKPFESCHKIGPDGLVYPYFDPVGFPTQGWGRLLSREAWWPTGVRPATRAERLALEARLTERWPAQTRELVDEWFDEDMKRHALAVLRIVRADLSAEQLAALIDFAFNAGPGNLQVSTLRRMVERGEHEAAADQFLRWIFAAGIKLPGLVRRRQAERELYLSGTT